MSGPSWLIVLALVLVAAGAVLSLRVDDLEVRSDFAGAWRAWLCSRVLAAVGVLLGAAGLIWEMTQ